MPRILGGYPGLKRRAWGRKTKDSITEASGDHGGTKFECRTRKESTPMSKKGEKTNRCKKEAIWGKRSFQVLA